MLAAILKICRSRRPKVDTLETDAALLGTTLTGVLISALLAKANLFAILFANPIGVIVGGAIAGGSFIYGRKALKGEVQRRECACASAANHDRWPYSPGHS